jgi:hypothetical protein
MYVRHAVGPHPDVPLYIGIGGSASIGLGDEHLYEELARPLDRRQIVPAIQERDLANEANAVYRMWFEMPGRLSF